MPLINTIAEYFLLKTVVSQRQSQKRGLKRTFFLLRHKNQYLITSRDAIISISLTVLYGRDYSETADRLMRYIFTLAVDIFHYLTDGMCC